MKLATLKSGKRDGALQAQRGNEIRVLEDRVITE